MFKQDNHQKVKSPLEGRFRGVFECAQTPPVVPLKGDRYDLHFLFKYQNFMFDTFYLAYSEMMNYPLQSVKNQFHQPTMYSNMKR